MQDSLKWWGKTLQLVGNQTEPRSQTAGRQASIIRKHKTEIHEPLCVFLYGGGCIVYIQLLSFFHLLDCLFFLYHFCIKGREGGGGECDWFSFGWIWGFFFGQIVSLGRVHCQLTNQPCPTVTKCKWPVPENMCKWEVAKIRSWSWSSEFHDTVFYKEAAWLMYFFLESVVKYCRCRTWGHVCRLFIKPW
jgi:hypothetical protein